LPSHLIIPLSAAWIGDIGADLEFFIKMSFDTLGLSAEILRALSEKGYDEPTPVQSQAIPFVLQGRDIMASAQTGTGKTAAFTLPILQLLTQEPALKGRRPVRALILTPTRELAAQIGENVVEYSAHLAIRSLVVFGGVSINPQMMKLRSGVDVLVATPGRLLDLAQQRAVDLSNVEILVLDEADRMLDMGFIHDIRRVMKLLPVKRQSLMFSATFSDEIKVLANTLLSNPASVSVARSSVAAEQIEQCVHMVDKKRKRELLSYMIGQNDWRQVLVFTRTKHGANHLAELLNKDGITSAAIHGNKSQGARTRALADFKQGKIRVLVATDIAARGLDIDLLPHVVNYELPQIAEDYVHRIGRTGRAAATGEALSLVCVDELGLLRDIERLLKRPIPRMALPGYDPDPTIKAEPLQTGRGSRPSGPSRGAPSRGAPARGASAGNGSRDGGSRDGASRDGRPPQRRRDGDSASQPGRSGAPRRSSGASAYAGSGSRDSRNPKK